MLSAILHLGNIEFDVDETTDELDIVDESHFLHGKAVEKTNKTMTYNLFFFISLILQCEKWSYWYFRKKCTMYKHVTGQGCLWFKDSNDDNICLYE